MSTRERAEAFTRFVGLELKGQIASHGFTAVRVAETIGRSPAAFNRWLNGKLDLPLVVLCEACEVIDVEPSQVVGYAYDRMSAALGERSGFEYPIEDAQAALNEAQEERAQAGGDPHVVDINERRTKPALRRAARHGEHDE